MRPTKRSAMALARGAHTGVLMILMLMAVKTGVEGGGELGVSIVEEKPEPLAGVVEIHGRVAGLLGQPRSRWPGGERGCGGRREWRVDRAWQALWSSGGRRVGGASAESWPV